MARETASSDSLNEITGKEVWGPKAWPIQSRAARSKGNSTRHGPELARAGGRVRLCQPRSSYETNERGILSFSAGTPKARASGRTQPVWSDNRRYLLQERRSVGGPGGRRPRQRPTPYRAPQAGVNLKEPPDPCRPVPRNTCKPSDFCFDGPVICHMGKPVRTATAQNDFSL